MDLTRKRLGATARNKLLWDFETKNRPQIVKKNYENLFLAKKNDQSQDMEWMESLSVTHDMTHMSYQSIKI